MRARQLSGLGVEGGKHGLLAWTNMTAMVESKQEPSVEGHAEVVVAA